MKKAILLLTIAFLGLSTVNAQQIDLGNAANSSRCGASTLGTGFGSTGSGFIQNNNVSTDAGFIVEADKDFDKIRVRYAANSTSGGTPLDGVYKITVHNDNNCSSSFPVSGTSYTFPHTGGWSTWEEITLNVSGSEGEYIHVRPTNSTGGINPDWVEFASTIDLGDPANSKTCGASVIATNASGYTGMGFRANNNQSVDAGFIVQADKKFSKIRFRYAAASGGGSSDGVYNISVQTHDDCNTSGPDFVFPATGGWSTWEEVTFNISGNEGEYLHLRRGNTTGGMNPDWIEFVPSHKIWTGTENTDWNNANNWISGIVPSASADITISTGLVNYPEMEVNATVNDIEIGSGATLSIQPGQSLTVEGTLTNDGTITVESGGALVQETGSTLAGSGTYNVQREITEGQRFIGSPINEHSVSGFGISPSGSNGAQIAPIESPSLFRCNADSVAANSPNGNILEMREDATPIDNCAQSLWHVKSTGSLGNGRGYAVNATSTIMEFSGTVNNATVSYSGLGRQSGNIDQWNGSQTRGWHLVSNPYPSPIRLTDGDLGGDFDNAVYLWDGSSFTEIQLNLSDAVIAVGQGFQIRKSSVGGSATFSVNNDIREGGNPTFYKQGNGMDGYLEVTMDNQAHQSTATIYFEDGASAAFDPQYDAVRLFGSPNIPLIYTLEENGENLSYNALPLLENESEQTVPLSLYDAEPGEFTLSFDGISSLIATVMLEDLKLSSMTEVTEASTYTFTTEFGDSRDRFKLHFQYEEEEEEYVGIAEKDLDKIRIFPNPTSGTVHLVLSENHAYRSVNIMDLSGRTVISEQLENQKNSYEISTQELDKGIYFIQINEAEAQQTLKLIKQ